MRFKVVRSSLKKSHKMRVHSGQYKSFEAVIRGSGLGMATDRSFPSGWDGYENMNFHHNFRPIPIISKNNFKMILFYFKYIIIFNKINL